MHYSHESVGQKLRLGSDAFVPGDNGWVIQVHSANCAPPYGLFLHRATLDFITTCWSHVSLILIWRVAYKRALNWFC